MLNTKSSLYWWCQFLGWGSLIPYWLHFEQPVNGSYLIPVLFLIGQVISQIIVTDGYRRLAHRFGWVRLSAKQLVPVVLVAWFLLVGQYQLMGYFVFHLRYDGVYNWDIFFGAMAGGLRYHAIWLLGFHGYHFARQSARAEAAAARGAKLAVEAQLAKLNAELNPHFLFNALNGIKALTREDTARSRQAIDRLAELLRYSLRQSEREVVPLCEEIHITQEYVALEQMRLEERLQVNWYIEPGTEACRLPPLSLHTLVENGIKHGINQLEAGGAISVRINSNNDYWVLTVTNDGDYRPTTASGSGLKHLRQRLLLQYEANDLLHLTASTNGRHQTTATLKIPIAQ
ncbi:sensor histidine kinase [Neolewinella persica]|uniref:sensor histidine kinase n=1 Tax=Neolewinella persica TaxID=70998 RepID=UPI000477C7AC|nr:histidine kinase [Neolewinella persica]